MKVLHINKFFDLKGGAEIYMHNLMRRQAEAGLETHVFSTRSPSNLPSRDASTFVTRYNLSISESPLTDLKKAANFLWNREAKTALAKVLRDLKPDAIHLHNIYHHLSTSILAPIRESKIPCVQTLHDLKLACPNYRMYTEGALCERCKGGRYFEAVKHRCLFPGFVPNALAAMEMGFTKAVQAYERTVKTFICPSQFIADKMVEWGEPAPKFRMVRSPVEIKDRARRDGGYVLAVGRLSPEKGYEELIRAAALVPSLCIKIAGTGPLEDRLRSLIRANKSNIELVGFKRGEELAELYRHAEAFVACPVGYENAPLTVLDALGVGLPILASRIGGLPEMVEDGRNGYLVEHGSVDAWAGALKEFSELPQSAKDDMAEASIELARRKFPDWPQHLEMIRECYEIS
ncbi:glycosyltransferase [Patescibacteria group bacterium]|nr:glycosyltransferase [Patescibacteria group bacterium]